MPEEASFVLPAPCGMANAVRRSLLSDVRSWAPHEVVVRVNTSCQTDEFVAHRIGLVPFRRVGHGTEMELRAEGPGTVYARDLVGPAFEAVHGGVPLLVLGEDQQVDATVRFDEQPASVHARYAQCAGVGMEATGLDHHRLTFHVHDPTVPPSRVLLEAIDLLEKRVDKALLQLANQPAEPPRSLC